ncbi:unnamed protein product [Linum tenue]|uniref:Uncharacterized protein n=1 Tax=Linum tenue TaxID=586396 RepID=A0AAV0IFN2_9ROSI|nr:unnamed protein product [Linum tenue]
MESSRRPKRSLCFVMLRSPSSSLPALARCMTTAALPPRKSSDDLYIYRLSTNCFIIHLIHIYTYICRLPDILEKYHKQSGKRLWDAKHEVWSSKVLAFFPHSFGFSLLYVIWIWISSLFLHEPILSNQFSIVLWCLCVFHLIWVVGKWRI